MVEVLLENLRIFFEQPVVLPHKMARESVSIELVIVNDISVLIDGRNDVRSSTVADDGGAGTQAVGSNGLFANLPGIVPSVFDHNGSVVVVITEEFCGVRSCDEVAFAIVENDADSSIGSDRYDRISIDLRGKDHGFSSVVEKTQNTIRIYHHLLSSQCT